MSLLLEALKKAELAKQSADTSPVESRTTADSVITRDTLPDISQALDIRPNDLPSAGSQAGGTPFGPAPVDVSAQPAPERSGTASSQAFGASYGDTAPTDGPSGAMEGQRAAARQMFEAKEADLPHPRRNFYITLGILGLAAAGYGGYVWWQMQPRSLYNAAAIAKKGGEAPPSATQPSSPLPDPIAAAAPATGQASPATAVAATEAPVPPPLPVQSGAGMSQPQPTASSPARAATVRRPSESAPIPQASRPAPARGTGERPSAQRGAATPIAITPPAMMTNPQIERAYAAFQLGDLAEARSQYQVALQRDVANRDALLGLAAIDVRTRNYELAESRYLRLLEADPRDAYALAGLMALRGQTDPVQSESRLKSMIATQPDVAHLHFALGNQYAAQSRWPDAQASYFRAFSLDPDNPDFAFNLAVSLDQLRQAKPALDYYRRALALAGTRPISFDRGQVSARVAELMR